MGTKSKQRQSKKKKKWDLGNSQQQMVVGVVNQQQTEINMIRRHHNREMTDTINTLRKELGIPEGIRLGLDMQTPGKMFVREITEEELKQAMQQQAQQTNGEKPPSAD